ncbi:hypothetical protein TNCV_2427471 [Trichonephila clavipes]|nr:hypothetical protein TNCV_2427471 [Trichonephila clavipes]
MSLNGMILTRNQSSGIESSRTSFLRYCKGTNLEYPLASYQCVDTAGFAKRRVSQLKELWKSQEFEIFNAEEVAKSLGMWEIVNPDDPDQDNGRKLLNCSIVIGP